MRARVVPSVGALLVEMAAQIEAATRPAATPRQAAPSVTSEQDLRDYLWQTFGIRYPSTPVCATHTPPWHIVRDAYFAVYPVIVLKGSRGFAGKTTILGGLAMAESCLLGADVMLLGGSARQSRRVHQAMSGWWSAPGAPRHLLKDEPGAMFTRFLRGNEVEAVPASQRSVRGGHAQRLRVDEADEMDLALLDAAMGGAMGLRAGVPRQTLIASTHQYPDKTFSEVLRRAGEKGWPVMEVCVAEGTQIATASGALSIEDIKRGDHVYTHQDGEIRLSRVVDQWCSGVCPTVVIRTGSRELVCTSDHRILTTNEGWRCAETLRVGELVFLMSEVEGRTWRRLSKLSNRQKMRDVWQSLRKSFRAVQVLCREAVAQRTRAVAVASLGDVSGLSWSEAQDKQEMPEMFQDMEYRLSENDSAERAAPNCSKRKQSQAPESRRDRDSFASRHARAQILCTGAAWQVLSGFRLAGLWHRYRSQRKILAQQRETERERRREARDGDKSRLAARCVLGRRTALMGIEAICSVEPGPTCLVYDVTVEDGESFIANGIIVHNCYRETVEPHGWLPVTEVHGKRAEMTEAMWRTEVELQEPSAEGRALDPDAVERMFVRDLGESDGRTGQVEEFEAPMPGATYSTGADWGKAHDYTAIPTLRTDCQPMRFVAFYRDRKKPFHLIVPEFDRRLGYYGGVGCHDAHGIGAVVDEMLERKHLTEGYTQWQGPARMALFSEYISAIERGQIQAPLSEPWYRAHRYVTNDDLYGNGHPPDEFVGCALAYRAARAASRYAPLELLFQGGQDGDEIRAQLEAARTRLGLKSLL